MLSFDTMLMVGGGPPVRGNIFGGKRYGDAKRYGGKKDTEIGARLMAGKQDTERRKKDMAGDKRYGGSSNINNPTQYSPIPIR